MHTLVWPVPHRPVQLGWTWQECETPTDIALGVIEVRKPSHTSRYIHPVMENIVVMSVECTWWVPVHIYCIKFET